MKFVTYLMLALTISFLFKSYAMADEFVEAKLRDWGFEALIPEFRGKYLVAVILKCVIICSGSIAVPN
jgi:hypothetical protein